MSDSEDYMSDKFLQSMSNESPGIVKTPSAIRERCKFKRQRLNQSLNASEHEMRKAGLSKKIDESNKGYKMLLNMGYTKGSGLGKTKAGIIEPIDVKVKDNRLGLGVESARKRKADTIRSLIKSANPISEDQMRDAYIKRRRHKFNYNRVCKDLSKARLVCEQLDCAEGFKYPVDKQFWEVNEDDNCLDSVDIKDDDEDAVEDKELILDNIVGYLRKQYNYCIWCGNRYNDACDLESNCPGTTIENHDC
ncbi:hypothetical protein GJ496_005130 [Pomphorhynchus laevis]|nr:hypothetical protein GJ496_005130 [Pomphorhynchus laevis]